MLKRPIESAIECPILCFAAVGGRVAYRNLAVDLASAEWIFTPTHQSMPTAGRQELAGADRYLTSVMAVVRRDGLAGWDLP